MWMPQSWKQGQVRLIPTMTSHKPLVMHNPSHYSMHTTTCTPHMVAWWLRDSMTTLCSPSQCAFIASRYIRNSIVLVNSLIDANTDGVIMMLDWAMAYDSVDHGYMEKVVFCMGCDGIGLQRLMSTAKGFTLHVIGSQSVSESFSRERGVGQGCPLAPFLFALAIEPLSQMLKQTMTAMQIHHIHVKQHIKHAPVAMCADDTTTFANRYHHITHAMDAIQCHMDASSAPINRGKSNKGL